MLGEKYESRTRLKVWKVRAGQRFTVRLMRHEPLGHIVHWLGKCSVLCAGVECGACLAGVGARWVGTMPCRLLCSDGTGRTVLVEFSGDAWARTGGLLHAEGHTDNRGVIVELTRGRSRSGLVGDPCGEPGSESVVEMADWVLIDALATLYGLPRCLEGWTAERWTTEVREAVHGRVRRGLAEMAVEVA